MNTTGITPTEYKVLVLPDPVEEKTKGGIILADMTKDHDKYSTTKGTLIEASHLAFTYATDEEWAGHKPKPGDRVLFARHAGVRHTAKDGREFLLLNDKDVVALIKD